ncbi:MAG: class I adenylate-forming enzyme family protein [Pseudomonadota bacterium]
MTIPAPAPLIPDVLRLHGRWRARKPAASCGAETLSWAEFDRRTEQVANGLAALGLGRGDFVGVVMTNGLDMLEALFGAVKSGACVVPLNVSVADDAIESMLRDCGAKAVIASEIHRPRLDAMRARLPAWLPLGGVVAGTGNGSTPVAPGWQPYRLWRDAQRATPLARAIEPEDPCNLIYSSGTTALPKGILHGHRRRLEWAYDVGLALRYQSNAVALLSIGLYSNISWVGMLCTFLAGGHVVVMEKFDATDWLAHVERWSATHTAMVPVQYQRLVEHPERARYDTASMRSMMSCGSPLQPRLKQQLIEAFRCEIVELYGLTEGVITTLDPEDVDGRLASVGKPIPGTDLLILGEDGRPVPQGEPGEIVGLSRFVMHGYLNREDATREATWTDPQGRTWLRTGDVGRLDEEGFLYVVDRRKDMILSGGQNVYPADLEAVLCRHPDVLDVAVIGVPHPQGGETPLALVVRREGASVGAEALRAWANERLGRQQRLGGLEFRDALPRNANGKVLKRELRTPYWAAAPAAARA